MVRVSVTLVPVKDGTQYAEIPNVVMYFMTTPNTYPIFTVSVVLGTINKEGKCNNVSLSGSHLVFRR